MNDLVHLAMHRACELFGDAHMFNGACFSKAFTGLAGVSSPLDGRVVQAMLCGRTDVQILAGGAHYRLIPC